MSLFITSAKNFRTLTSDGSFRNIKNLLLLFVLFFYLPLKAQVPAGYYDNASGKQGEALKTSLHAIIGTHDAISYSELWTAFSSTDKREDGYVWDMYSDVPGGTPAYEFTFSQDQCGNYQGEGDCYNREHSFPKSWFNDATPMYTDLFHIYPTDGYVNGRRSNYPYGETGIPTYTSSNGSKLGPSSFPGYGGIVFEPIDSFKGDFARTYFYMVTCYENLLPGWSSEMLDGSTYPAFTSWAVNILLEWNDLDPVSKKERDRNNVIFNQFQHNRNPFIDHPEFAGLIWEQAVSPLVFTSDPVTEAYSGTVYNYSVTASYEGSQTIAIKTIIKPDWLNFTDQGNGTGILTGTPPDGTNTTDSVVILAVAGQDSAIQNFVITVTSQSTSGGTETFENMPADNSAYLSISWIGDDGSTWSAGNARTDQVINNRAVCLKDAQGSFVQSGTIQGGCGSISFKHQQKFSGTGGNITLFINDVQYGQPVEVTQNISTSTFENLKIEGSFVIKLVTNGLTRIAIDDISWQGYMPVNQSPVISPVSFSPATPRSGDTITFLATITDADGSISQAFINWGTAIDSLNHQTPMTQKTGDYTAKIITEPGYGYLYFTITAVDDAGGTTVSGTDSIFVSENTMITEMQDDYLKVYPVPAREGIYIKTKHQTGIKGIDLLDSFGRILKTENYPGRPEEIYLKLNSLHSGFYFIRIRTNNSQLFHKILVE